MVLRKPVSIGLLAWLLSNMPQFNQTPEPIKGWGSVVDPKGDSRFEVVNAGIKITVPAGIHNLVASENTSAPRVLRPASGDFIAQVKVLGDVRPSGPIQSQYFPYHGTGLLLWEDDKNYVRLERAAILRDGAVMPYINFEVFRGGQRAVSEGMSIEDKRVWLRLERRGKALHAAASLDGNQWKSFRASDAKFAETVRIGVTAVSNTNVPFTAHLDEFAVFQQKTEEDAPAEKGANPPSGPDQI
jgi:regulation of enolase protein 1 (concanavalin A-like superfamily)